MTRNDKLRREKLLSAAEGYLELDMPEHALAAVNAVVDPEEAPFLVHFLRGDALRQMGQYATALESFQQAALINAESVPLLMAMAWCYKRTDQLHRAITTMDQAYRVSPKEPVLLYNLACYWTLAGNKGQALSWLGRALRMDKALRKLIPAEHDFDALRGDPDFQLVIREPKDVAGK